MSATVTKIRIQMLGGFAIAGDELRLDFSRRQAGFLLARLATPLGQEVSRESLCAFLWPDSSTDEARARLRQRLYALGQQLASVQAGGDQALRASRDSISLDPALITTDLAEFELAVSDGMETRNEAERSRKLERAVELYGGPLLPGFYQDCFLAEQARIEDLYWKTLQDLCSTFESLAEPDKALQYGRKMAAIDPLSEECCCSVMRLLGAAGRPQDVLRQYEALEKALESQLGTSPSHTAMAVRDMAMLANVGSLTETDTEPGAGPIDASERQRDGFGKRVSKGLMQRAGALWLGIAAVGACGYFGYNFRHNPHDSFDLESSAFPQLAIGSPAVDYSGGFNRTSPFAIQFHQDYGNGYKGPQLKGGALELIDGHIGEAASVWLKKQVPVKGFDTSFRFKASNPSNNPGILADGFTLTLQSERPDALGGSGGSLGYAGVANSFCLAIYFHRARNDQPLTQPTWGLFAGGHPPLETQALPLDVGNGHTFKVDLTYDGKDAVGATMEDEQTGNTATIRNRIPVGSIVKSATGNAWIGFTGATGMGWANLQILSWTFSAGTGHGG